MDDTKSPGMGKRFYELKAKHGTLTSRQKARLAFAGNLVTALKDAGMTQGELAKKTGVSQSLVSSWTCAVSMPGVKQMQVLAELFGQDVYTWDRYVEPEPEPEKPGMRKAWLPEASCPPEDLIYAGLTEDEYALVYRARRMPAETLKAVLAFMNI